ncbi:MAG: hypothetical protein A2V46_11570 [Bacteroidetes bacterium RBG_19FT_COMBO_42_7]|nr:MAG: hypothetical protein A2V46_11570 [Bacteroidetes bacterium RBG_19FT_COMBO_42_7]
MVKKISFLILAVAILVIGIITFSKLSYWDRSVRIFSFSSAAPFEGRMGRGPGGGEFEGRERSGGREGRPIPEMRERNIPDSLRQQFGTRDGERMGRGPFEGGIRNGESRGRGEFPGSKKINLRNVVWFLAVFASFTVVAIYLDKTYCLIRKRKVK